MSIIAVEFTAFEDKTVFGLLHQKTRLDAQLLVEQNEFLSKVDRRPFDLTPLASSQ